MRYYPLFVDLRGRRCVVVGGGRLAEGEVRPLLQAGADVHIISPDLTPRLALLAARKNVSYTARRYQKGDLNRPLLVFAATNDPETQAQLRQDAGEIGVLVYTVGDPETSTFVVPASFAQGELQVAISTQGSSPTLARKLGKHLQATLFREYRAYARFLRMTRRQVMRSIATPEERAKIFQQLPTTILLNWFRAGASGRALNDVKQVLAKFGIKASKKNS